MASPNCIRCKGTTFAAAYQHIALVGRVYLIYCLSCGAVVTVLPIADKDGS